MGSNKLQRYNMWTSFLKTERKIKNYLLKISDSELEPYIDDMYHDVILLSMKRKIDSPERDDSLCLFSAYDVVSSRTRYYQDVIRKSNYVDSNFGEGENEFDSIDFEKLDNMVHLGRSIAFGLMFTCIPDRFMFSWLMSSDIYKTRSDLARYYDVSRERARQLEEGGNTSIKGVFEYFSDLNRIPTFLSKDIKDKTKVYEDFCDIESNIPDLFSIDYQINSLGKSVFDAVLIFLWASTVFSGSFNVFEDLKYRGFDPEPVLSLRGRFLVVDELYMVLEHDRLGSCLSLYDIRNGTCLFSNYEDDDSAVGFVRDSVLPLLESIEYSSAKKMYIDEISFLLNLDVLP